MPKLPCGLRYERIGGSAGAIRVDPQSQRALAAAYEHAGLRLVAVRHAQSETNAGSRPRLCGRGDPPLTELGRMQARHVARALAAQLGDADLVAFVSPLQRCVCMYDEFARCWAGTDRALECVREPRLIEMSFGEFEDCELEAFRRDHASFAQGWDGYHGAGTDFRTRFPGGECRIDVLARVGAFAVELVERHRDRAVLVFAHLESIAMLQVRFGACHVEHDGTARVRPDRVPHATPLWLPLGTEYGRNASSGAV